MVDVNYNEFTNSIVHPSEMVDPMFRWGEHFPERLSRLHHSLEVFSPTSRRQIRRSRDRYKTQPITFDEITEVDEDNAPVTSHGVARKPLINKNQERPCSHSVGELSGDWSGGSSQVSESLESNEAQNGSEDYPPSTDTDGSNLSCSPGSRSGFTAAVESARRRRKYSKRCRRRKSDMQEEVMLEESEAALDESHHPSCPSIA